MMPHQTSSGLDLGLSLSLGLTSQGSLSSSTTTAGSSSPWAAALSSVVADVARARDAHPQYYHHHPGAVALDLHDRAATPARASTSPDSSAAALSSGDNTPSPTKRERATEAERVLERTASGGVRSDADEEDGADGAGGRKKLRLSKDQAAVLEECFKTHSTLNPKQKVALANRLGLRPRQVEVWFQNRRARTKLKQTEVDCEYLKRWCEQLAEENRRLVKEVAELRALSAAPAAPLTTLTMCLSCRRVASSTSPSSNTSSPNIPAAAHAHAHAAAAAGSMAAAAMLPAHRQFFCGFKDAGAAAVAYGTTASSGLGKVVRAAR